MKPRIFLPFVGVLFGYYSLIRAIFSPFPLPVALDYAPKLLVFRHTLRTLTPHEQLSAVRTTLHADLKRLGVKLCARQARVPFGSLQSWLYKRRNTMHLAHVERLARLLGYEFVLEVRKPAPVTPTAPRRATRPRVKSG